MILLSIASRLGTWTGIILAEAVWLSETGFRMGDHVTRTGLKELCKSLKNNDRLRAQLAIENHPRPRKREICVQVLKLAAVILSSQDCGELIRAATYTMIACK